MSVPLYHIYMTAVTLAHILEIQLDETGSLAALVSCPPALRCMPGQYLLADWQADPESLPVAVFPAHLLTPDENRVLHLSAPLPSTWASGGSLALRGPLGHGFSLPPAAHRVALASLAELPWRLLPLLEKALQAGADVILYANRVPDGLPLAVEVAPLAALPEALSWASYLALDAPLHCLPDLRAALGLAARQPCPCSAQVLVYTPMPCGSVAACSVCAVRTRHGWRLACKDGPVFDLDVLEDV